MTMDTRELARQIIEKNRSGGSTSGQNRELEGYSTSELRQLWRAGRIDESAWKAELQARGDSAQQAADEIARQKNVGLSTAAKTAGQLTASEAAAVEALKASAPVAAPPAQEPQVPGLVKNVPFLRNAAGLNAQDFNAPGAGAAGSTVASPTSSRPSVSSGGGAGGSGSPAAAASPAIAGDYVWNNGRPYIAYQGQKYMLPPGVQEDDPRVAAVLQRLGGGNTAGSVTGDSKNDLYLRGATDLGKATVLNGQQYRMAPGSVATQGADGKWYIPGSPTPFTSEAAAKAAMPLVNVGAGLTSRMGNSPTAKAAAGGGFGRTVENPLFNTIGLDQSIAAGATKGNQVGDILGTISNNTKMPLDITLGGISEGGGLTPVGNPADPYASFTGQIPGDVSVGMSSILGNSGVNTQYWLSQMSGLPPAEIAKLNINTPEKALQFQQAVETLRAQGMMPNFASLYALNEPAATGGAYGGSDLKWGSANGGANNTPYDQALSGFANYALGSPDLTYLPDPTGYGSTQVGNVAYANSRVDEYGTPLTYGKGGAFTLNEPSVVMGLRSRKPYALLAEAGKQEKVTIQPTQEDITMNREMGMGLRPLRGGKPMGFAAGGTIYAGGNKGFVNSSSQPIYAEDGTVTDYGQRIGYKSDPFLYGGGALGGENQNFMAPQISKSGQPVPASFEFMGIADKERFANQGNPVPNERISGPIGQAPVGYQPYGNTVLPVYDQLNPQTYDNLGEVTGYRYVPINNGGTPALVRVPEYSFPAATPNDVQRQQSAAFLMAMLNGSDTGNMSPGSLGFQGMPDSTNRAAILAKLYELDPAAWAQAVSAGAAGQNGNGAGMGGGLRSSQDIQNEAFRQRYYGIDARNRGRAGMDPATILNIPRVEGWQGEGQAPYQQFNGRVPEGYALPFDYEPGSPWFNRDNSMGGGMGGGLRPPRGGGQNQMPGGFNGWYGGDMRTPEPMGGNSPWGAQLPQWVQNIQPGGLTRYAGRRQRVMQPNSPLGAGLAA